MEIEIARKVRSSGSQADIKRRKRKQNHHHHQKALLTVSHSLKNALPVSRLYNKIQEKNYDTKNTSTKSEEKGNLILSISFPWRLRLRF